MQPHRCSWAGRESWPQPSRRQEAVGRWPVSWRPRWQPPTSPLETRGRPGDQPELSRSRGQGCLPPPRGCLEEEDPGRRSLFHRSAPHPQAREGGGPAENRTQPRGWERQDILSSTWGNSALPWRRGRCRGGRPQHICAQREAAQGVAGPLRCGGQCGCGCPCPTLRHPLTQETLGALASPRQARTAGERAGGATAGRSSHLLCPGHILLMAWPQTLPLSSRSWLRPPAFLWSPGRPSSSLNGSLLPSRPPDTWPGWTQAWPRSETCG